MSSGSQSGSQDSSEDAEEDLQEAMDNLDQLQQQMQQQDQQETLFQIEQELKKMLGAQKKLLVDTQEIEKQRPSPTEALPRRARLQVRKVHDDQRGLADATKVIVKKMEEEGVIVFREVLQWAVDDMGEAAVRLDKEQTGTLTQNIQEDILKQLSDLIDALRKERNRKQQQQQQGGGGGGGGGPLVPPLAELKMLQIMQKDVNRRTQRIDQAVAQSEEKDLTATQKDELRRMAQKEGKIAGLTKELANSLEQQGGGGPPDH